MDTPAFRQQFKEFVDPEIYLERTIAFWRNLAATLLPEDRWGDMHDYGVALFVAHHLVIGRRDEEAASLGGAPGEIKGPLTSRTVEDVSQSWASSEVSLTNGGFWNMTSYGVRFLQYARLVGAGGIQL